MKNGIYGLASLNGAPLDPSDLETLSLGPDRSTFDNESCAIRIVDTQRSAIDVARTHDGVCALLGHLDEPHEVADLLGVDRKAGNASLAAAAHARWGADMATKLLGEWMMVRWHSGARGLTLIMGECVRDDCHFATNGGLVAFSPELRRLARLSWIGGEFDPDNLLRSMGTYAAREAMDGTSIIRGVSVLRAGEQVVVDANGVRRSFAKPPFLPPIRRIAFDDAIVELREMLHRILKQQLERSGDAAFLLSGGLDSSLLATFGANALPKNAQMSFLTSAAPIDSQLEDETNWAAMVSDHLGIPMTRVTPGADCDFYKPEGRTFRAFERPLQSPRHYLYEALEDAALDQSKSALIDGVFGEMTVSNDPVFNEPQRRLASLRRLARAVRDAVGSTRKQRASAHSLARISPDIAPDRLRRLTSTTTEPFQFARDGAFGIRYGAIKAAGQTTHCSAPALRFVYPFRDRRLIRLMASYPASFATHGGQARAPVRHMMRGRLPGAVVDRTSKLGFSPTHDLLLRQHSRRALARLADDPVDEASHWLDLDWLKAVLSRIDAGAAVSAELATQVQVTAVAAEFFRWWKSETPPTPR